MSVEFKAATNFLRSVATAAKVMADALEQAEKDLAAATAVANAKGEFWRLPGAKGSPLSGTEKNDATKVKTPAKSKEQMFDDAMNAYKNSRGDNLLNGGTKTGRCPPEAWISENACLGLSYADLVAMYNKETDSTELSGAEQNDLGKNAAEVGVSTMILTDANAISKPSSSWCVSSLDKQTSSISSKEQLFADEFRIRKMETSTRLLDRFVIQHESKSKKTCIGGEHVKRAYDMSILTGIIMIEGESLAFPMYKGEVDIEIIPANSEDAKRLPEGAKVVGLMRYACAF